MNDFRHRLASVPKATNVLRTFLFILLSTFGLFHFPETNAAEKPNIVFLLADDLGYGDLGCYGGKRIATPHLDQLASEGMRFTQAYAGGPVCTSSQVY